MVSSSFFHRVDDREVAVDHRVHQRVEDERRAVAQQVRLALGALAHAEEALRRAAAHREHEVGADEDADLADLQLVGGRELDHVHDREHGVAVLLDLRPLVAVARVLDRQVVQAELALHLEQLVVRSRP